MNISIGFVLLVSSVFILPTHLLPHRASVNARLLLGMLALFAAGALLGREFLA